MKCISYPAEYLTKKTISHLFNELILVMYASSGSALIISAPGVVTKETANNADFTWNLTEPYNNSSFYSIFWIHKGYPGTGPLILQFTGGICSTYNYTSLDCITDGKQIGFNITNISDNNASVYSLSVDLDLIVSPPFENDSGALLYIYSEYIHYSDSPLFINTPIFRNYLPKITGNHSY